MPSYNMCEDKCKNRGVLLQGIYTQLKFNNIWCAFMKVKYIINFQKSSLKVQNAG